MNLASLKQSVKSASPIEIALVILFIIYLVLPIETPQSISPMINSPIGMLGIFIITLYLFLYTNPVLGILYIFVAYELLRRSSQFINGNASNNTYLQYTPSQERRNTDLQQMNPAKPASLEEDIVSNMAPIGRSDPASFVDSTFKPIGENIHNAFSI